MDRPLTPELRARGYNNPERIVDAVKDAQNVCTTLRPAFGSAPVADRESARLFLLTGNIYLASRKKNIPLDIWLAPSFPNQAPLAVVKCPPKTLINPGSILDRNGRIAHPYLDKWTKAGSTLGDFVQIIASDFAEKLPYFSLKNYNFPSKVTENINRLLQGFPSFALDLKRLIEGSGPSDEMILASGTINTAKRGVKKIQCVDIWLHEDFPQRAPLVYVYPWERRGIKSGTPEYRRARVDLPYLHDWHSKDHCLQVLVSVLIIERQTETPVTVQTDSSAQTSKAPWFLPEDQPKSNTTQCNTTVPVPHRPKQPLPPEANSSSSVPTAVQSQPTVPKAASSEMAERVRDLDLSSSTFEVSDELHAFALEFDLSDHTLRRLAKDGFRSLGLVLALTEPDLKDLGLSELAEVVKLREAIKKYRGLQCTPETEPDINEPCGAAAAAASPPPVITGAPTSISEVYGRAFQSLIEEIEVDACRLKLNDRVGQGQYGIVYKGTYDNPHSGMKEVVAVKTLSSVSVTASRTADRPIETLLQEIIKMKPFKHKNVMELKGLAFVQNNPCCVMSFMDQGDLKTYVSNTKRTFTVQDLLTLALGVAEGMKYLEEHDFVHGDLAARNCLLDSSGTVKVSDFGLSRQLCVADYFTWDTSRNQPVRWMAIEALTDAKVTRESDRWSFAILLMELMTRGELPYPEIHDTHLLIEKLEAGYRMPRPEHVDIVVYALMEICWDSDRFQRPSFNEICGIIKGWFESDRSLRRSQSSRRAPRTNQVQVERECHTIPGSYDMEWYLRPVNLRTIAHGQVAVPVWYDEVPVDLRHAVQGRYPEGASSHSGMHVPPDRPPAVPPRR